ncbi:MAG TPA: glutamine synthetase family protein [Chitinophagales bacterium]|nr:glutamine synthetase family protein [Chitinophagales bacterium]
MPEKSKSRSALSYVRNYPAEKVKLAITDIDGILRGKVIHRDKFFSVLEKGFGFCDVVFGWDAGDVAYDNTTFTGWHSGYPDANAKIDVSTFRKIPWDNDIPFFLADFADENGTPSHVCPRNLLKKIRSQAIQEGFHPIFSQEFEWFNFAETPDSLANKNYVKPQPLTPGMFGYSILRSSLKSNFFNALFDNLKKFDVPIEGIHTETGPGVYEAAIQYADILEAADRATLFKTGVKEIAQRQTILLPQSKTAKSKRSPQKEDGQPAGIMASFMAKWNENLPGCSGHVHQSLWDSKRNLFFDAKDKFRMSEVMKSYVAGQLHCLPHILPLFAPTINSYKRLVEGAWAPTTITWGMDNRTTALRVLTSGEKSSRLETRVVGSDVNPYLAMAGCLASGLYGVKKKMKLTQPPTTGNGYRDEKYGVLPRNLWEATQAMKNSDLAKELFGEKFVEHFTQTREWEWRQFSKAVTDWELKRYFEII